MSRKIDLFGTRDLTLALAEFWHGLLAKEVVQAFGRGVPDQISRFTGRAVEVYRLPDTMLAVRQAVLAHKPSDRLLAASSAQRFMKDVGEYKRSLEQLRSASEAVRHRAFPFALARFAKLYPFYMLSNFFPGLWAEEVRGRYGKSANALLKRWFRGRTASEGSLELLDGYLRALPEECLRARAIDERYARVIRLRELESMLAGDPPPTMATLKQRIRGYVLYRNTVVVGKTFAQFLRGRHLVYADPVRGASRSGVHGVTAYQGPRVRGAVHIVLNAEDAKAFPDGNILVTTMTAPDFLPAMKRAKAIVTDEGGLTCHAAITSRELKLPCLIATKIATKVFRDGDRVAVDTKRGLAKKL